MRNSAAHCFDPVTGNLANFWVDEHDGGHPVGCSPIVVMDVWGHAFMTDYGTDRGSYIEAFMANIDWEEVRNRVVAARSLQAVFH